MFGPVGYYRSARHNKSCAASGLDATETNLG
jgi:hypothetical protein